MRAEEAARNPSFKIALEEMQKKEGRRSTSQRSRPSSSSSSSSNKNGGGGDDDDDSEEEEEAPIPRGASIAIRNCRELKCQLEPPAEAWEAAAPVVEAIALVDCGLVQVPSGIRMGALSKLRRKCVRPRPSVCLPACLPACALSFSLFVVVMFPFSSYFPFSTNLPTPA